MVFPCYIYVILVFPVIVICAIIFNIVTTVKLYNTPYKNMTKHIKHIIEGARRVLVLIPDDDYVRPSKFDFCEDIAALRKDSSRVAKDLKTTLNQYDKQIYNSKS